MSEAEPSTGRARGPAPIAAVIVSGIMLCCGPASLVLAVDLSPVTFYELVSIGGNSTGGHPVSTEPGAEIISETPGYPRGTGTAGASTTNILPLLADGSVVLRSANSPATYAGSAETRINVQFAAEALSGALVPVNITTHAFVNLDLAAGPAGGAPGSAFAILGIPGLVTLTADVACAGHVSTGASCSSNNGESFSWNVCP